MDGPRPLKGHIRLALARQLAEGGLTQTELGERYGVTQQAISDFARRERDMINAIRNDLDNQYAGLWIANKEARLAAYERDVDDVERVEGDDVVTPELRRVKQAALRAVAEELGQLPARMSVQMEGTIKTIIEGIDPMDVR